MAMTTVAPPITPVRRTSLARLRKRARPSLGHPGVAAVLAWLVTAPPAALVPVLLDLNPFDQRDADVPLAFGALAVLCVGASARFKPRPVVFGVAAGVFAAFTVLVLRTSLHGTPFGFS